MFCWRTELCTASKTDFCTISTLLIHPRASTTTGTTSNFFSDQSLFSSLFNFWYFPIFSISFSCILQSPGIATPMMTYDFAFLSTKIKSGLLASITLSHWIFISQISLTSSSSTAPSGQCSYHFSFLSRLCFSHNFQWTNFATVSSLLLYSRYASFLHSHIICCTASPHILHNGFFNVLSVLFFV